MPISAKDWLKDGSTDDLLLRLLVLGWSRVGKAQPIDEPVLTPTGWQEIGSLREGDLVIGSSGKPVRVTGVFPQGTRKVLRVTADDGSWARCCPEHLWLAQNAHQFRHHQKPKVRTAAEMARTIDDVYYLPRFEATAQLLGDLKSNELPLEPYYLGLLLGDGGFTGRGLYFYKPDEELLTAVEEAAKRIGDAPVRVHYIYEGHSNCPGVRINGGATRSKLRTMRLLGLHSREKFVPEEYLTAAAADRLRLLQGLCDTDGYCGGTNVEYSTASIRLRDDVCFIVRSLGGRARVSEKWVDGIVYWRILITFDNGVCPLQLTRKKNSWSPTRETRIRQRVVGIDEDGEAECVCISVAAPDKLYVTRDFLVTHNTTTILKTCPKPALVIFTDHDPQRLRGAYEFTKDFEVEEVTSYNSAVAACKIAHEGAKSGKYKTVLLDTLSSLSTVIENECEIEDKRANSSGKANGMKYFFVYRKRIAHIVRNLVDLPCHFIAASHYGEEGNSDAIQENGEGTRKRGKRLVPLLVGQARGEIPREFRDIVWLDIRGGERVFQCGPDHEFYGPACNTIQALEAPADIGELIRLFREGSPIEAAPKANGAAQKIPQRIQPAPNRAAPIPQRPQQVQRQPIRK